MNIQKFDTIIYKNFAIDIYHDEMAENPREWVNSTLVTAHRRYSFGSKSLPYDADNIEQAFSWHLNEKGLTERDIIALPVYLYEHGGIALSMTPFSCRWDSGQLGFIYETRADIREEFGIKRISPKLEQQILERLRHEIDLLSHWANGDVFGYKVIVDGDIESCWGFYGWEHEESGLLEQARATIDALIRDRQNQHFARLKKLIKSKVSFAYRPKCPVMG
ncbi:hypothetical protein [Suttonella ornithocola]|uniref:Uncharacterized protein n=1 Tax=Suttonella ornithocola TaxID=279832 RepID=A0A380MXK1_9GAMM|nr:hypothetical protein [Suttonella ornithocola]SUO96766.1 Uncharacterised protein [Suttonella ornithocola]